MEYTIILTDEEVKRIKQALLTLENKQTTEGGDAKGTETLHVKIDEQVKAQD